MANTKEDVLKNLKATLEMSAYGLMDLKSSEVKKRNVGLRNLAIHGRSITFVIQNLRNKVENFDKWYKPIQEEIKSSELCEFFKDMRNKIEKQGETMETEVSATINKLSDTTIKNLAKKYPKPKNSEIIGFFIGDQLGGSGWELQLPDGSIDKVYLDLPESIAVVDIVFAEPPKTHLKINIEDKSVQEMGEIYFTYLSSIVDKTIRKWK